MAKYLLTGLGWSCVILGTIGVFLPLLPTTPFLLVAAWAFAKSSPRFRHWLVNHRILGPYIRDWREHRAIPLKAKFLAIAMITASTIWLIGWSGLPTVYIGLAACCLVGAATFILTRRTMHKGRVL